MNRYRVLYNNGFTLIEIAIVLIVIASMTVITAKFFFKDFNTAVVDQTIEEIKLIQQEAIFYFAKNGKWPDQSAGCVNPFSSISGLNVVLGKIESPWFDGAASKIAYKTDCSYSPASFSVALTLIGDDKEYIDYINNKLPLSEVNSSGDTIHATIPAPSGAAALNNFLKRENDAPFNNMETSFNMNGNVIKDVDVGAISVFEADIDGESVISELMIIPEDSSLAVPCNYGYGNDASCFSIDVCRDDSSCYGSMAGYKKAAFGSVKANDIFLKSTGEYISDFKSKMKWRHMEHFPSKTDGDSISKPVCEPWEIPRFKLKPVRLTTKGERWYHPGGLRRCRWRDFNLSTYIEFDYSSNWGKWDIDIDIDYDKYASSICISSGEDVEVKDARVSVDTYCVK